MPRKHLSLWLQVPAQLFALVAALGVANTVDAAPYTSKTPPSNSQIMTAAKSLDSCNAIVEVWGRFAESENRYQVFIRYKLGNNVYVGHQSQLLRMDDGRWLLMCTVDALNKGTGLTYIEQ